MRFNLSYGARKLCASVWTDGDDDDDDDDNSNNTIISNINNILEFLIIKPTRCTNFSN